MTEPEETSEVQDEALEPRPDPHPDAPGGEAEEASGIGSEVVALRQERDHFLDLAKRAQADFENFRKRSATQVADAARKAKGDLAREILPAIDALERALDGAEGDSSLERGVAMVRDQLLEALKRAGVEAYDPKGERFDPTWHEALSTCPAPEGAESGAIVEVLDRGYRADGQVLRPARVVVAE